MSILDDPSIKNGHVKGSELARAIREVMAGEGTLESRIMDTISAIVQFTEFQLCSIYIPSTGTDQGVLGYIRSEYKRDQDESLKKYISETIPFAKLIAKNGQAINSNYIEPSSGITFYQRTGYACFSGVPITKDGRIIGVLAVSNRKGPLDASRMKALEELAEDLAGYFPEVTLPTSELNTSEWHGKNDSSELLKIRRKILNFSIIDRNELAERVRLLDAVLSDYIDFMETRRPNESEALNIWTAEKDALLNIRESIKEILEILVKWKNDASDTESRSNADNIASAADKTQKRVRTWWECHERSIKNQLWKGAPAVFRVAIVTASAVVGAQFGVGYLTGTAATYFLGGDQAISAIYKTFGGQSKKPPG